MQASESRVYAVVVRALAVAAIAALATACSFATSVSVTRQLREAQESFSSAAAAENAARTQKMTLAETGAGGAALGSAASGYALAAQIARGLRENEASTLERDGLFCPALTVEAMSLWRLGKRDDARTLAENAGPCRGVDAPPRDRTLLLALPGLVEADDAYRLSRDGVHNYETVKANVMGALGKLEDAAADATPRQPVYVYLLTSQLAVLRTWSEAIKSEGLVDPEQSAEFQAYKDKRDELLREYRSVVCDLGSPESLDYWSTLLGSRRTCSGTP